MNRGHTESAGESTSSAVGTEQRTWAGRGGVWRGGGGRGAQHHQGDGLVSSLGRVSMGREHYAVVISLMISL